MSLADLLRAAGGKGARAADYDALASAIRSAPAEARAHLDGHPEASAEFCHRGAIEASDAWLASLDAALAAGSECVTGLCLHLVAGIHPPAFAASLMEVLRRHGHHGRVEETVRASIREFIKEERARDPFAHTDPWGNPTNTDDLLAYIVRGYIEKLPDAVRPAAREEARSHPEISGRL